LYTEHAENTDEHGKTVFLCSFRVFRLFRVFRVPVFTLSKKSRICD